MLRSYAVLTSDKAIGQSNAHLIE